MTPLCQPSAGEHVGERARPPAADQRLGLEEDPRLGRGGARSSGGRARRRSARRGSRRRVSSSSRPASARSSRPAALIRGARRKPTAVVSIRAGSARATRMSARRPGRFVVASARRPARTRRRFSPRSGTQSAIVASATRSRSRSASAGSSPGGRQQRGGELVGDAGGAEVDARVAADGRVHDRRVGQDAVGARAVVVGDDDVDAGGARRGDLVDGGDRAVGGDQQLRPARGEALHGRGRQAVAVLGAAGQKPVDVGAERAQDADEDRRRADAVDVVVAVDRDAPARAHVVEHARADGVDAGELRTGRGARRPPARRARRRDRPGRGARAPAPSGGSRRARARARARRRRRTGRSSGGADPAARPGSYGPDPTEAGGRSGAVWRGRRVGPRPRGGAWRA